MLITFPAASSNEVSSSRSSHRWIGVGYGSGSLGALDAAQGDNLFVLDSAIDNNLNCSNLVDSPRGFAVFAVAILSASRDKIRLRFGNAS